MQSKRTVSSLLTAFLAAGQPATSTGPPSWRPANTRLWSFHAGPGRSALLPHHPVVVAGGAPAFGTAALHRSLRRDRYHVQPSARSYLWRVEREITQSA